MTIEKLTKIAKREEYLHHREQTPTRLLKSINVKTSALDLFNMLKTSVKIDHIQNELFANSLRGAADPFHNPYDTYVRKTKVTFFDDDDYGAFRIYILSSTHNIDLALSDIEVFDDQHRMIDFVPLLGEIVEDDFYVIPLILFIDLKSLEYGQRSVTIQQTDLVEKSLPNLYNRTPGMIGVEPVGSKHSLPCDQVDWRIHLPRPMCDHIQARELSLPDAKNKTIKIASGSINTDFPGAPVGLQTIRWVSNNTVQEGQMAGVSIVFSP